ncbi:MAG: hypothetical protein ACAI44_38225, partial [Candidatus Sericytochromatia bacterium]
PTNYYLLCISNVPVLLTFLNSAKLRNRLPVIVVIEVLVKIHRAAKGNQEWGILIILTPPREA